MKVTFTEHVYTGNHYQGQNSGNYEERIRWLAESLGVAYDEAAQASEILEHTTGAHTLRWGGRELHYTVQQHRGSHDSYGYRWSATYES